MHLLQFFLCSKHYVMYSYRGAWVLIAVKPVSLRFLFLLCMDSDVMTDVIIVMGIRMQNHKCNEVENAFRFSK